MKAFPPPLTPSEEQYYVQKYIIGDSEAKDILIERNLRLVSHIVKKYQQPEENPEDLISIGTIGLIKAIATFNPQKNNKLGTYAAKCIENEVLMYFRSKKKFSRDVSLYEPIGTDHEGNEIQIIDIIESNEKELPDKVLLNDQKTILYQIMEKVLTPREKQVLMLRYGLYNVKEQTQREIADFLGISRSYVSRIEKAAIEKLRPFF